MLILVPDLSRSKLLLLVSIRPQVIEFLRLRLPIVDLAFDFEEVPQVMLVGVVVAGRKGIGQNKINNQQN